MIQSHRMYLGARCHAGSPLPLPPPPLLLPPPLLMVLLPAGCRLRPPAVGTHEVL